MPGSTAILIFSRTARQEAAVKTFDTPLGKSGNASIARRLIRQSVRTVRSTGIPFFVHFDRPDHTLSFGARLANAVESVFERGFSRVIAIGTDSPELSSGALLKACRILDRQPLVLGPAADGGVYLIGLDRAAYQRALFIALPWQTCYLQEVWQQQAAGNLAWLETVHDIDSRADFKKLLRRLHHGSSLFQDLAGILASYSNRPVLHRFPIPVFPGFRAAASLRGPPAKG